MISVINPYKPIAQPAFRSKQKIIFESPVISHDEFLYAHGQITKIKDFIDEHTGDSFNNYSLGLCQKRRDDEFYAYLVSGKHHAEMTCTAEQGGDEQIQQFLNDDKNDEIIFFTNDVECPLDKIFKVETKPDVHLKLIEQ